MKLIIEGLSEKQKNGFAMTTKFSTHFRDESDKEYRERVCSKRKAHRNFQRKKVRYRKLKQIKIVIFCDENTISYEKNEEEVRVCIS